MLIGFRTTRRVFVNVMVGAVLLRLLFMGLDGMDRFADDWNRVTGANMEGSGQVRDALVGAREHVPDEADRWLAQAKIESAKRGALLDFLKSVVGLMESSSQGDQHLPYGSHLEDPYGYISD